MPCHRHCLQSGGVTEAGHFSALMLAIIGCQPGAVHSDQREPTQSTAVTASQPTRAQPTPKNRPKRQEKMALAPLSPQERRAAIDYRPSSSARRRGSYDVVGQAASNIRVSQWTEGSSPKLNVLDAKGSVLVMFAFQSWCPSCETRGFPISRKLEKSFTGHPVVLLYVQTPFEGHAVNDFSALLALRKKWSITRPMAQDSVGQGDRPSTMRLFRTGGTPWHIIVDRSGIVRFNDFSRNFEFHERMVRALLEQPS